MRWPISFFGTHVTTLNLRFWNEIHEGVLGVTESLIAQIQMTVRGRIRGSRAIRTLMRTMLDILVSLRSEGGVQETGL